ncbi:hypothetical protein Tco_1411667 [Tanacetum coccineum]
MLKLWVSSLVWASSIPMNRSGRLHISGLELSHQCASKFRLTNIKQAPEPLELEAPFVYSYHVSFDFDSSFANKMALMLSIEAMRYITNTSPLIEAGGNCLNLQRVDLDSLFGDEMPHESTFFNAKRTLLWISVFGDEMPHERTFFNAKRTLLWIKLHVNNLKFIKGSYVENMVPVALRVWNFIALWIIDTMIPIFCIDVLPSKRWCGELDLIMTKFRTSVHVKGPSPIVISRGTSPRGQECSLEKLTSGTLDSTLSDPMEGFNFRKQCS